MHLNLQKNLSGIKVKDVMSPDMIPVSSSMTIDELVHKYFLKYAFGGFPVFENSTFLGIVTVKEVKHIYKRDWYHVKVAEILDDYMEKWKVSPEMDVMKALEFMKSENRERVMVFDKGRIVGLLSMNRISRYMQIIGNN